MVQPGLRALLEEVRQGAVPVEDALERLARLPFEDLGFARVDLHRALRQGLPEVVFGEGKSAPRIIAIARELMAAGEPVLVTRVDDAKAGEVRSALPALQHHAEARLVHTPLPVPAAGEPVVVVTAGTSDLGVSEEAARTLEWLGIPVRRLTDVGVAGLHRLLAALPALRAAPAVVVVAGMEGALPSVVTGLVAAPVVAVPTSVGYGAALGGLTPLMGMLTACASGMTVVNIDNGFGAAAAVARMLRPAPGEPARGGTPGSPVSGASP